MFHFDSLLFCTIAFVWTLPSSTILMLIFWQWIIKVIYEIFAIPWTYLITDYLKRIENEDHYDYDTDFNPWQF
jgi:uncharacterized PurR-regulated membrane protein YhhQ (DUF165 family)